MLLTLDDPPDVSGGTSAVTTSRVCCTVRPKRLHKLIIGLKTMVGTTRFPGDSLEAIHECASS